MPTTPLKAVMIALAMGLALLSIAGARAADSVDPAAHRIEAFNAALVDIMKRGPQLGMHGRYEAMTAPVDQTFDIAAMIAFIVGKDKWATMSDADHKALTDAFRRMTIANYASNFDSYSGEHFDVDPNVQVKAGDRFVQSTLTPKSGKPVPFIYRMRETPSGWKVIDIYLNGYVSELATRRSDFAATVASGGAPELIKKLNQLADQQLAGVKSGGG